MVCFLGSDTNVRLKGDGFANQHSNFSRLSVKQKISPAPICYVLFYSSVVLLALSTRKASFIPAVSFFSLSLS